MIWPIIFLMFFGNGFEPLVSGDIVLLEVSLEGEKRVGVNNQLPSNVASSSNSKLLESRGGFLPKPPIGWNLSPKTVPVFEDSD